MDSLINTPNKLVKACLCWLTSNKVVTRPSSTGRAWKALPSGKRHQSSLPCANSAEASSLALLYVPHSPASQILSLKAVPSPATE